MLYKIGVEYYSGESIDKERFYVDKLQSLLANKSSLKAVLEGQFRKSIQKSINLKDSFRKSLGRTPKKPSANKLKHTSSYICNNQFGKRKRGATIINYKFKSRMTKIEQKKGDFDEDLQILEVFEKSIKQAIRLVKVDIKNQTNKFFEKLRQKKIERFAKNNLQGAQTTRKHKNIQSTWESPLKFSLSRSLKLSAHHTPKNKSLHPTNIYTIFQNNDLKLSRFENKNGKQLSECVNTFLVKVQFLHGKVSVEEANQLVCEQYMNYSQEKFNMFINFATQIKELDILIQEETNEINLQSLKLMTETIKLEREKNIFDLQTNYENKMCKMVQNFKSKFKNKAKLFDDAKEELLGELLECFK